MQTISRPTPYQLADAISQMGERFAAAEREKVYALQDRLAADVTDDQYEEAKRRGRKWDRVARYRFAAMHRLIVALRDLPR